MKDTSKNMLNYLKEHKGEDLTASDIATALGYEDKTVNGAVTSLAHRHFEGEGDDKVLVPLVERIATGEKNDKGREIKFVKITEAGMEFDTSEN